jgi:predicted amidohydrolase
VTLKLATTQPAGTADARENGRIVRELMRQAAAADVRLLHFPEGFLSGYAKEQIADWDDVDWDAVRDELRSTADLARELDMWVVLGSAHPLTPPHRRLATAVLDRDAPEFHIALDLARPWRAAADQGDIYRNRRVEDPRSSDRTLI